MQTQIIRRKRILLVEDEGAVRSSLKRLLEKNGYAVADVNNGAEALSLFGKTDFELVLTDYALPFMAGDELALKLKQLAPELPIVMLTGFVKWQSPANPVDAVLLKPFQNSELLQVLRELLSPAAPALKE